jgi:SAM-dependent methyltransferase
MVEIKGRIIRDNAECSHQGYREVLRSGNQPLYRCDACGLVFNKRYNNDFDARSLYKDYYRNEIGGRFSFGIEYLIRAFRFFRAFKIFTAYPYAKSILDIGSGRGFVLYYLKKYFRFKKAVGIQISKNACEFSRNKLGLEIIENDFLDIQFGDAKFDLVTLTHVLEHVIKPERYIEKIFSILSDHGQLIIEVPNFNSWTRYLCGEYWLGLDLDYHVTFFTPDSLGNILRRYGFKIRAVRNFSLEYSSFISAQSLTSLITKTRHIFFEFIQKPSFSPMLLPQILLFFVLFPTCLLVNLLLYSSRKGEILFIKAEKGQRLV